MSDTTTRLNLPFIIAGQAQKEVSHNEALMLIDTIVQPVVVEVAPSTQPVAPVVGQCWIVGAGATGLWAGRGDQMACWTDGGWRFVAPFSGMTIWSLADALPVQFGATGWAKGQIRANSLHIGSQQIVGPRGQAISEPVGGTVIDAEARLAIGQILARLRTHGLISA